MAFSVPSYVPVHEAEPTLIAQEKMSVGFGVDVLAADTPELAVWDDDAPETVLLKRFPLRRSPRWMWWLYLRLWM